MTIREMVRAIGLAWVDRTLWEAQLEALLRRTVELQEICDGYDGIQDKQQALTGRVEARERTIGALERQVEEYRRQITNERQAWTETRRVLTEERMHKIEQLEKAHGEALIQLGKQYTTAMQATASETPVLVRALQQINADAQVVIADYAKRTSRNATEEWFLGKLRGIDTRAQQALRYKASDAHD